MGEPLTEDERFDASQYAFFGGDVSHEVELGGLDEEDGNDLENEDERLLGFSEKDEAEILDGGSQLDDVSVDVSGVSSSYMNLRLGPRELDDTNAWSHHHQNPMKEARSMGAFNYPSQKPWVEPEPGLSHTSFAMARPYPPARPQAMPFQGNLPFNQRPHVSSPRSFHVGGALPAYAQYGGNQIFNDPSFQGPWMSPPRVSTPLTPAFMQQQMAEQHGAIPPHVLPQSLARISSAYAQAPLYNPQPSAPPLILKSNDYFSTGDPRDQHNDLTPRGRQIARQYPHSPNDSSNRNMGRQPFRSKYMTAEEIDSIARIQLAATHSNDPYIDDYYHQAVQGKIAGGTPHGRRRFAPSSLRDSPSHTRAPAMPPAFVPVDGLGRVPFSSIRRPRPLLEVDSGIGPDGVNDMLNVNLSDRPLEQEPMLAARIAIEDGLCLLLDVDDIDRYLSANQFSDNEPALRRRRQMLLEDLAASMQFVDLLTTNGRGGEQRNVPPFAEVDSKDDLVFLRIVSLPKGRKLVYRYLQLLPPGSHLIHIVCRAVFRRLRFLFGGLAELSGSPATAGLANSVANCVDRMNLNTLTSCLADAVFSQDAPPFRPLGSSSGDGATVIMRAALDRATKLLTDRNLTFPLDDRRIWQTTFDKFFVLLYMYCTNKYDSITHSLMMTMPGNQVAIRSVAAETMGKEMPVELLRASLPHMNEHQRESLLEFAQRSMATGGQGGHTGRDSHLNVLK